jgi:antitoxin VapB
MGTARVFRSGNSQAVRLPMQFRLRSKEVEIVRRGGEIVLREKDRNLARTFELLAGLPDDVDLGAGRMIGRRDAGDCKWNLAICCTPTSVVTFGGTGRSEFYILGKLRTGEAVLSVITTSF